MANPKGKVGMNLPISTYNKLLELRASKGFDSWDSTISKLIEMDMKYSSHKSVIEYEFMTDNISKVFRITFNNAEYDVEYYGRNDFESNISAWNSYPSISDEDKDLFIRFILNKANIIRLKDLQYSENFGEFEIRKIGAI